MTNKRCIHKIKNECKTCSFIILCARKSNNRGYKNIPLTLINSVETLIDNQINTIRKHNKDSEIIIVSGFEHDKLISHIHSKNYDNIRIAENKNYKNSTIIDGWRFALNIAIKDNTFIIHGDRVFNESCILHNKNTHTLFHQTDKNNYNLGILHDNEKFINMSYGLEDVWSEIFFISINDFDNARKILNDKYKKIHNIEGFINELSTTTEIKIFQKQQTDVKILKEI